MSQALTRKLALVVGAFYAAIGVLGFVPAIPLTGFATDPAHNLVHVLVGLLALWASQLPNARGAMRAAAFLFVLLMLVPPAASTTMVGLYFASALLAGYAAFGELEHATA